MKIEVTRTSLNITALIGWIGLILGVAGVLLQIHLGVTGPSAIATSIGLIGGAITVTKAGRLIKVERRKVKVKDAGTK